MNIVGHRGASAAAPENTPAAFSLADRMGADGVELDVRIAPDGRGRDRLVVFHDPLPTAQETLDALASFDAVLDACGDRMLINVEIKNHVDDGGHDPTMAVVAPTIDAMRRRGAGWASRWLISSFSLATIDHCRLVAPEFPTALLTSGVDSSSIRAAAAGGHCAIHPWVHGLTAEQIEASHAAGLAVNVWTCNDPEKIVELEALGVDGVCTDVPDVAVRCLGRGDAAPMAAPTW